MIYKKELIIYWEFLKVIAYNKPAPNCTQENLFYAIMRTRKTLAQLNEEQNF